MENIIQRLSRATSAMFLKDGACCRGRHVPETWGCCRGRHPMTTVRNRGLVDEVCKMDAVAVRAGQRRGEISLSTSHALDGSIQ